MITDNRQLLKDSEAQPDTSAASDIQYPALPIA